MGLLHNVPFHHSFVGEGVTLPRTHQIHTGWMKIMPSNFLSLPIELQIQTFNHFYYDSTKKSKGFGEPFYGRYYHFLEIATTIPPLWPICARYMHKWPSESRPIQKHLIDYVIERPQLKAAVEALDLTGQGSGVQDSAGEGLQLEPLLSYAANEGLLPHNFDKEELSDWVGLALQLLPRVHTLWLADTGMFGEKSTVNTILINNNAHFSNLRHISLKPSWQEDKLDLAKVISLLLDIPSLESMTFWNIGTCEYSERILHYEDVEHPEDLRSSRCTHFSFKNCFITRHELSIIAARCKPLVLVHYPFGDYLDNDGLQDEEVEGYLKYLEGLSSFPSIVENLEVLEIEDHNDSSDLGPPRMRPEGSMDLSTFKKLRHLTIPIHTLVGEDPQGGNVQASRLLPPSLETMRLDQVTNRDEPFRWELGDFLIQILDVLRNTPERFPKLRELTIDEEMLQSDDETLSESGRPGCLAEALALAEQFNVTLRSENGGAVTLPISITGEGNQESAQDSGDP